MKLRTFEIAFSENDSGSEGYEKPKKAHTAKTMNIPPRAKNVYFDRLVRGDRKRSEKVEITTRNRGKKKDSVTYMEAFSLPITIRANGSSNIIGAAAVPTNALAKATRGPCDLDKYQIIMNVNIPDRIVIGAIGPTGRCRGNREITLYRMSETNSVAKQSPQFISKKTLRAFPGL